MYHNAITSSDFPIFCCPQWSQDLLWWDNKDWEQWHYHHGGLVDIYWHTALQQLLSLYTQAALFSRSWCHQINGQGWGTFSVCDKLGINCVLVVDQMTTALRISRKMWRSLILCISWLQTGSLYFDLPDKYADTGQPWINHLGVLSTNIIVYIFIAPISPATHLGLYVEGTFDWPGISGPRSDILGFMWNEQLTCLV